MNRLFSSIVLLVLPATGATPGGSKTPQTKSSCGDPANPSESSTSDAEYTHPSYPMTSCSAARRAGGSNARSRRLEVCPNLLSRRQHVLTHTVSRAKSAGFLTLLRREAKSSCCQKRALVVTEKNGGGMRVAFSVYLLVL